MSGSAALGHHSHEQAGLAAGTVANDNKFAANLSHAALSQRGRVVQIWAGDDQRGREYVEGGICS